MENDNLREDIGNTLKLWKCNVLSKVTNLTCVLGKPRRSSRHDLMVFATTWKKVHNKIMKLTNQRSYKDKNILNPTGYTLQR